MNWKEFKKGKKEEKFLITICNYENNKIEDKEVEGYSFEEGTFIRKHPEIRYWIIYDTNTGRVIGTFTNFKTLYETWNNELKGRLLDYRSSHDYKTLVELVNSRRKENEN